MTATNQPSDVRFFAQRGEDELDADLEAVHGITSADIIAAGVASRNGTYATGAPPRIVNSMQRGVDNLVIVALGDSTGDHAVVSTPFSRALASQLAALFPAYTVNYYDINNPALTWPGTPTTVVQTGTAGGSAPILEVRNGCIASTNCSNVLQYAASNYFNGITADLVIFDHGHNESASGISRNYMMMVERVRNLQPNADLAIILQNPRNDSAANQTAQFQKMNHVERIAHQFGATVVDVMAAFINNSGGWSGLLQAGGIHPNASGDTVIANEFAKHYKLAPSVIPRVQRIDNPQRLWVPAKAMDAAVGAPTYAYDTTLHAGAWSLPHGSDTAVGFDIDYPFTWKSASMYAFWAVATTDAGNAIWRLTRYYQGDTSGIAGPGTAPSASVLTAAQSAAASGTAYKAVSTIVMGDTSLTSGRPVSFELQRTGTSGSDTNLQAALLLGVMIEREQ